VIVISDTSPLVNLAMVGQLLDIGGKHA